MEPQQLPFPPITARGEYVIILAPVAEAAVDTPTDEHVASLFGHMTENGGFEARRDAIRAVARQLHISSKAVFDALERVKNTSQT
jgi:hypothetical protein